MLVAVVVATVLVAAGWTKKVFVATRPLVPPVADIGMLPLATEGMNRVVEKLPFVSVVISVIAPLKSIVIGSDGPKFVPTAMTDAPGMPLKIERLRKAAVLVAPALGVLENGAVVNN